MTFLAIFGWVSICALVWTGAAYGLPAFIHFDRKDPFECSCSNILGSIVAFGAGLLSHVLFKGGQ